MSGLLRSRRSGRAAKRFEGVIRAEGESRAVDRRGMPGRSSSGVGVSGTGRVGVSGASTGFGTGVRGSGSGGPDPNMHSAVTREADMERRITTALTFDIHTGDTPDAVYACTEWLNQRSLVATAFVPSAMLTEKRYKAPPRELLLTGHELGSHVHHHDRAEPHALMSALTGDGPQFLAASRRASRTLSARHRNHFGPQVRCRLGR